MTTSEAIVKHFKEKFPENYTRLVFNGCKILDRLPEDRERLPFVCPFCGKGGFYFLAETPNGVLTVWCALCGENINTPRKSKNANKKKYKRKFSTGRYDSWLLKVREVYNNTCAVCNETENLEAHHIIPFSVDKSLQYEVNNGILLCKKHHLMAHAAYGIVGNGYKKD